MKPHSKIRKTVKWGGAVVTVLLLVLWPLSEVRGGHGHRPLLDKWHWLSAYDGKLWINSPWMDSAFGWDAIGQQVPSSDYWPSFSRGRSAGLPVRAGWGSSWGISVPIWLVLITVLLLTAFAWHLDTLARRRARVGRCPKCNYDRTGLAPGAVCPECGDATALTPPPTPQSAPSPPPRSP